MTIDIGIIKMLNAINKNSVDGAKAHAVNTYGVNFEKISEILWKKHKIKRTDEITKYLIENNLIVVIQEPTENNDQQSVIALTPPGILFLMQANNIKLMKRAINIAWFSLIISILTLTYSVAVSQCKHHANSNTTSGINSTRTILKQ